MINYLVILLSLLVLGPAVTAKPLPGAEIPGTGSQITPGSATSYFPCFLMTFWKDSKFLMFFQGTTMNEDHKQESTSNLQHNIANQHAGTLQLELTSQPAPKLPSPMASPWQTPSEAVPVPLTSLSTIYHTSIFSSMSSLHHTLAHLCKSVRGPCNLSRIRSVSVQSPETFPTTSRRTLMEIYFADNLLCSMNGAELFNGSQRIFNPVSGPLPLAPQTTETNLSSSLSTPNGSANSKAVIFSSMAAALYETSPHGLTSAPVLPALAPSPPSKLADSTRSLTPQTHPHNSTNIDIDICLPPPQDPQEQTSPSSSISEDPSNPQPTSVAGGEQQPGQLNEEAAPKQFFDVCSFLVSDWHVVCGDVQGLALEFIDAGITARPSRDSMSLGCQVCLLGLSCWAIWMSGFGRGDTVLEAFLQYFVFELLLCYPVFQAVRFLVHLGKLTGAARRAVRRGLVFGFLLELLVPTTWLEAYCERRMQKKLEDAAENGYSEGYWQGEERGFRDGAKVQRGRLAKLHGMTAADFEVCLEARGCVSEEGMM